MTLSSLHHLQCPDSWDTQRPPHRLAYWQWGQPDSPHVVLCVHGLSRQGRDFDALAQALCARAAAQGRSLRVICPDLPGRGESDWLADPMAYQVPTYAADMLHLLAHLQASAALHTLDWVGTSLGGLIALAIAGQPELPVQLPVPIRRLVINDVGPVIQWQALARIGAYLGQAGEFSSIEQAADALWAVSSSFGPHTRAQWLDLSRPMLKPVASVPGASGAPEKWRLHYDPAIAVAFRQATPESAAAGEALLWQLYDQVQAQTLLLRGQQSDLLSPTTAQAMTQRGPRAQLIEFAGVGHAPTLVTPEQQAPVLDFLLN